MMKGNLSVFFVLSAISLCTNLYSQESKLKIQIGHSSSINSIAIASNGKYCVSGSLDRKVIVWDLSTRKEIWRFNDASNSVIVVAFSPDSKICFAASDDRIIRAWSIETGELITQFIGHSGWIRSMAISHDGKKMVSGSADNTVKIWDIRTGKEIWSINRNCPTNVVSISNNDRYFATDSSDGTIAVWNYDTYEQAYLLKGHSRFITSLAFSFDDSLLVSGSADNSIKIWDLNKHEITKTLLGHSNAIRSIGFFANNNVIATGSSDRSVIFWDIGSGKQIAKRNFIYGVNALSIIPNSDFVVLGLDFVGGLKLVSLSKEEVTESFYKEIESIFAINLNQRDSTLVSAVSGHYLKLFNYDLHVSKFLGYTKGHFRDAQYSLDGKSIATASDDSTLRIWDVSSGANIKTINCPDWVNTLTFSPNGEKLIWGLGIVSGNRPFCMQELNISTNSIVNFYGQKGFINTIAYSPNGKYIASGAGQSFYQDIEEHSSLMIWDTKTGKLINAFKGHSGPVFCVAFSLDSKFLLSGSSDKTIKLWEIATGKLVFTFTNHSDSINDIICLNNTTEFLSSSSDGTIKQWDYAKQKLIFSYGDSTTAIKKITLSQNGKIIVSANGDGSLKYWKIKNKDCIASVVVTEDNEWLIWTPDGYFNGTPWAMKNLVYIVRGLSVYSIDQFFEKYYRPDIILTRLNAVDTPSIATTEIMKGFSTPPITTLMVKDKLNQFQIPEGDVLVRGLSVVPTQATDWLVKNGTITVRIKAIDTGGGIDGVRLFNSGKAIGEEIRGITPVGKAGTEYIKDFIVPLTEGENLLRGMGYSLDRTESSPFDVKINYKPLKTDKPKLFILAIGADTYRNSKYNLNFAIADSKGFVRALTTVAQNVFSDVQTTEIYDEDLTPITLRTAFKVIENKSNPQDVFIFFYAGHGIAMNDGKDNVFWFVLPGVTVMNDLDKLKENAFSTVELRNLVAKIPANKQMLLVDACNSGAFLDGFAVRGAAEENALAQLQRSAGIALFSASTEKQFANEVKDLGHGLFTWALIQGLNGASANKEGKITAFSLKAYIDETVPLLAIKYRGSEQFPLALISGQDFPVGVK